MSSHAAVRAHERAVSSVVSTPGEFALVLHTHLPYVRGHGVWPVGEDWLLQACATSWLPVTEVLLRLAEDGQRDVLTLSVTPTVAHQLADARLRADTGAWIATQMWLGEQQRQRAEGPQEDAIRALGSFHWRTNAHLLALWEGVEAAGGLLAVWADLARHGVIELLGGPATHAYLPLQLDPRLIDAQLDAGLSAHDAWAGARPRGLWSPECGYRPAGPVADAAAEPLAVDRFGTPSLPRSRVELPGLEEHFAAHGITHVVVDGPTLVRAAGGVDRDWTQRPSVPDVRDRNADEVVHDGVLIGDSDVVAFARDLSVAYRVWSPHDGYPGDAWYRDFHARGDLGQLASWRVTDKSLAAEDKAPYDPAVAARRVEQHAAHLHAGLRQVLDPRPGALVVAAYDTELFGHWWFEGPQWLESLLRRLGDDPTVRTTTLASRLERRPPTRRLHLPESSWGYGKGHGPWVTPETRLLWRELRRGERRFAAALAGHGGTTAVRDQAARELALAQASDWPYLINRGDCAGYARDRFHLHLDRLHALCAAIELDRPVADLDAIAAQDDAPSDVSAFIDAYADAEARTA